MMYFNVVKKIEIDYVEEGLPHEVIEIPERVSVDEEKVVIEQKQYNEQKPEGGTRSIATTVIIPLASIRKLKVEEIVET